MKEFTGTDVMDSLPLTEYFKPLEKWLTAENEKHGEFIGWRRGTRHQVKDDLQNLRIEPLRLITLRRVLSRKASG